MTVRSLVGPTVVVVVAGLCTACPEYGYNPEPGEGEGELLDTDDPNSGQDGHVDIPDGVATGGVQGSVCAGNGELLSGVKASIEHEFGVSYTFTDDQGNYELLDIPAGEHTLLIEGADYATQIPVQVPVNEIVEIATDECQECEIDVPCIGLAEATSREAATIQMTNSGIVITNGSDYELCLDEWVVVISEESQDAALGQDDEVYIGPDDSELFPYSVDVYGGDGNTAWWCVERYQYTDAQRTYRYNGSLLPQRLFTPIHDRTDWDDDDDEDHADLEDLAYRTQYNVWDTIETNPVILVGRTRNLVTLEGAGSAGVIVEVTNLGRQEGVAAVYETVPAGFLVTDVAPTPEVWQSLGDGATQLGWTVALNGSNPDTVSWTAQTGYDVEYLTYRITAGEDAPVGRIEGNGLSGVWDDADGGLWSSESEPLIIEHCED